MGNNVKSAGGVDDYDNKTNKTSANMYHAYSKTFFSHQNIRQTLDFYYSWLFHKIFYLSAF